MLQGIVAAARLGVAYGLGLLLERRKSWAAVLLGVLGFCFWDLYERDLWGIDSVGLCVLMIGAAVGVAVYAGEGFFGERRRIDRPWLWLFWSVGAALFYTGVLLPLFLQDQPGGITLFGFMLPWPLWNLALCYGLEDAIVFKTGPSGALGSFVEALFLGLCRYYTGSLLAMVLLCVIFYFERVIFCRIFCKVGLKKVK